MEMYELQPEEKKEMQSKKKYLYIALIAFLLMMIGGLLTYLWVLPTYSQTKGNLSALEPPRGEKVLSNVRNTDIVQAVKQVGPAVVGITTRVYDRDIFDRRVLVGESIGSGVIFDAKGYIVTNYHVVGNSKDVSVLLADGTNVPGKVIGGDPATDLAVIKIEGKNLPVAVFGDSDSLVPGETAIAIGNPLGLELRGSVTVGVISALNRTINPAEQRFPLIQTDAAINQGNSGGALVNAEGKVIGINSIKIANAGVEGLGFSIPINSARPILKQLIEHGQVRRPYLGLWALDKQMAARYGYEWKENGGILVLRVDPQGPLARTPIGAQTLITAVDGHAVTTLTEFRNQIEQHHPGENVVLRYRRGNGEDQVTVRLGEAK